MPEILSNTPKRLSRDISAWGSEILGVVKSWVGLPPGTGSLVSFDDGEKGRNKETGDGSGVVELSMSGKTVRVPIVIRKFELQPLDVMEHEGDFYPLTRRRINHLNVDQHPFSDKVDHVYNMYEPGTDIRDAVIPPGYQRGIAKAFAEGDGFILPKILITSKRPEYDAMLRDIDDDSAESYYLHGTHDVLTQVRKKLMGQDDPQAVDVYGTKAIPVRPGSTEIVWVPKPSLQDRKNGFVTMMGCGGRAFDPEMMRLPMDQMMALYSNADGGNIARKGIVLNNLNRNASNHYADPMFGIKRIQLEDQKYMDDFEVLIDDGSKVSSDGYRIINKLIDPLDEKKVSMGFLTNGNDLVTGTRFFGSCGKKATVFSNMPMSTGDGGSIYDADIGRLKDESILFFDPKRKIAIGPIQADYGSVSHEKIGDESVPVSCVHGRIGPTEIKVYRVPDSVAKDYSITKKKGGAEIVVPSSFKCVRVWKILRAANDPSKHDYLAKTAGADRWIRVTSRDGVSYSIDLPGSVKQAYLKKIAALGFDSFNHLSPDVAEFFATCAGLTHKEAELIVKTAEHGSAVLYNIDFPPTTNPDLKKIAVEQEIKRAFANNIRVWLLKAAEEMTDKKTVDAMLGLGLADENNADTFLDHMPRYEEIVQQLAANLVDTRLQGGPIKEKSLKDAMTSIENVLEQGEQVIGAKRILDSAPM